MEEATGLVQETWSGISWNQRATDEGLPRHFQMQLKLIHYFGILAGLSVWFALLTQVPIPLLILAPFVAFTGAAFLVPRGPFLVRAAVSFLAAVVFEFASALALVAVGIFGGWREEIMPTSDSFQLGSVGLVIGFTIWSVFAGMLMGLAWVIARCFSSEP
jgi:hypothetical protein